MSPRSKSEKSTGQRSTKRVAVLGMLAVAALLLTGCVPRETASTPDPALQGNWQLISAADAKGKLVLDDTYVSLHIRSSSNTSGVAPCGEYTAAVTGQRGIVFVAVSVPTSTFCVDNTTGGLSRRYFAALRAIDHAAIVDTPRVGPVLTLTSAGVTLRYAQKRVAALASVIGVTWRLRQFPAQAPAIAGLDARLRSISLRIIDTDRLRMSSPCESLGIVFSSSTGGVVSTTSWAGTRFRSAACTPEILGLTTALEKLLVRPTFTLERFSSSLVVKSQESGKTAVFSSAPEL